MDSLALDFQHSRSDAGSQTVDSYFQSSVSCWTRFLTSFRDRGDGVHAFAPIVIARIVEVANKVLIVESPHIGGLFATTMIGLCAVPKQLVGDLVRFGALVEH